MEPMPTAPEPDPPSPCVGICALGADGLCIGCFRSREDLQAWGGATPERKRAILARCREREQAAQRR